VATNREVAIRTEIVRCCARLWKRRLVTGTSGNVSVRLGDDVLVTPARRSLDDLSVDDLIAVDPDGRPRDGSRRPTSELALHLAAYRVRPEVASVVHTHPTFCVIWSRAGRVFPQDTVGAREALGRVGWAPYFAPGSPELAAYCADEFSTGVNTILMERHGLTAIGVTLNEAFDRTDLAEEAARIAYYSSLTTQGRDVTER
jgi:L-fuculose-phosphate aldolase